MTTNERKLAAAVLRLASDQFANHGCNDFDMSELVPDQAERDELVRAYFAWNGDPSEYFEQPDWTGEADYRLTDWEIMIWMADRLENE